MTKLQLDPWQIDVLKDFGTRNIVLRSGRQCGKSTCISFGAGSYAVNNKKKSIMVISATERQAYLLFSKILAYIHDNYKSTIKTGKDKPTKHEIRLKNGSIIRCLPTGLDGLGIRGFTVDVLIADEAAFIPQDVWPAVTPMLATTGGVIILLSTPFGREGYFFDCFQDPSFTKFHVSTVDVANGREDPQKSRMLQFLQSERKRMSALQYTQEYLGEFVDELRQMFPDELIKRQMQLKRREHVKKGNTYFCGCDPAGMGRDEGTIEVVDRIDGELLDQVENVILTKKLTTETVEEIIRLHKLYDFKKIYVDDGGVGFGVFSGLFTNDATKRKVVALNNASRPLDKNENPKKKRILKEDLYMNTLSLLEKGQLRLLDDPEVFQSFKSVQFEYQDNGKLLIFGNYTHIVEGLNRAVWCMQDKRLNLWCV